MLKSLFLAHHSGLRHHQRSDVSHKGVLERKMVNVPVHPCTTERFRSSVGTAMGVTVSHAHFPEKNGWLRHRSTYLVETLPGKRL